MTARKTIGRLLDEARTELAALTPREAYEAALEGALLVDVRSLDEQARQGVVIPLAVHHPLSVVLWRLDPAVETSNPKPPLESRIVLICREGYCSGLAAQRLRQIGFRRATDVAGGVDSWVAAGLPTVPFADRLGSSRPLRITARAIAKRSRGRAKLL